MIAPLSWLKDFTDIEVTAEELQEKLFSCGFEVEELTYLGKDVTGVVTGKIVETKKHPDADRLTICIVDCGSHGTKQICTAATNVFEGAIVPCALDGATVLHEGGIQKIKSGKLRGELSEGMMCSGEELGINNDYYEGAEVNGILILDQDEPVGEDIRKVVGIDDWLFDVAVTANRPDCQCILGLAREVAAVLKKPFKMPDLTYHVQKTKVKIPVTVEEPTLCPRYIGHYVQDVKIGVSPRLIRRRLALCGLRSVSNIVDVTNYVLLEMGQPMHAFDRDFLRGGKIVVRRAKDGEEIVTLDEKEFTLSRENLLICDGEGGVALAGIMGGLNSEIKDTTKEVFFEAAKFARDNIRRSSRSLGQRSDSSARYEKGVDAYTTGLAMDRALHLVESLGCGVVTDARADVYSEKAAEKKVVTSLNQICGLIGISIPKEEALSALRRLNFNVTEKGDKWEVAVPPYREDVDGWPDLAEEVIRLYGYEHLVPTFLKSASVTSGGITLAQRNELKCKNVLKEEGFFEALNHSFYSPKDLDLLRLPEDAPERRAVKILNPIGEDLSIMRTVLVPSMIGNIVRNVRRGNDSGRLFELANVYLSDTIPPVEQPKEQKRLTLGLWGEGDFFDLKGAVEAIADAFDLRLTFERGERSYLHPGVTAVVKMGEKEVGVLGELHPAIAEDLALEKKAYLCELDYAAMSRKFAKDIEYHTPSAFPDVERDLAVVVDEERTCAEVEACILKSVKAIRKAELFDVYRSDRLGEGKKSMAFRLTFEAGENAEKPLSPEAVDSMFYKAVEALKKAVGAQLR